MELGVEFGFSLVMMMELCLMLNRVSPSSSIMMFHLVVHWTRCFVFVGVVFGWISSWPLS